MSPVCNSFLFCLTSLHHFQYGNKTYTRTGLRRVSDAQWMDLLDGNLRSSKRRSLRGDGWLYVGGCIALEMCGSPSPDVRLDFSMRQQVTIYWRSNPQNELHKGRLYSGVGCGSQNHYCGLPTNETEWMHLDIDTDADSPLIHIIYENKPTT